MKLTKKQGIILLVIVMAIAFLVTAVLAWGLQNGMSGKNYNKADAEPGILAETALPKGEDSPEENEGSGIQEGIHAWTEEINKYSLVLGEYQMAERDGFEDIKYTYPDVNSYLSDMVYEVKNLYFVFEDLAGDGEPELLIAAGYAGQRGEPIENYCIVDMYGFNDTKPQKLFEDDSMGSTSQYYLCDEGRIKKIISGKENEAEVYAVKAGSILPEKENGNSAGKYQEKKIIHWRRLKELPDLKYEEGEMLDDKLIHNEKEAEEYLLDYASGRISFDLSAQYQKMDEHGYNIELHVQIEGTSDIISYYSVDENGRIYSYDTESYCN